MADLVPSSEESISSLLSLEQRIPQLLSLLSQALEGLLPPPEGQEELEEGERFLEASRGYYELLDDVQLELRTSIHHLRLSSALPLVADFTPKAGPSTTGSGAGKQRKERQVEREALEERKWALQELLRAQSEKAGSEGPSKESQVAAQADPPTEAAEEEDDEVEMEEVP